MYLADDKFLTLNLTDLGRGGSQQSHQKIDCLRVGRKARRGLTKRDRERGRAREREREHDDHGVSV